MPNPLKLMMATAGVSSAATPGALWAYGYPSINGTLGDGTSISRSSPVQIGTDTWLDAQLTGYAAAAIKSDGTLWTWGQAFRGQLGDNTSSTTEGVSAANRSSPVQVGTDTDWSSLSGGSKVMFAIKTDGTMWAWGYGSTNGNLGVGDKNNRSSPTQIGALTTWSKVGSGGPFAHAIKTDGTLWAWGYNGQGQLGDGTVINRSSPVQIGSLTTWTHANGGLKNFVGRTSDGKVWATGKSGYGVLSIGSTSTDRSSPVQVGDLTNWTATTIGYRTGFGIKSDYTLWGWGNNLSYKATLAQGNVDVSPIESPVQVGALTNWSNVPGFGTGGVAVIKSDGTLWNWGQDYQLADGANIARSSPVQVGSGTDWSRVSDNFGQVFFVIKAS